MEDIVQTLMSKKLDSWGSNLNDFKAEKELTVEITLNEYRELIKSKATKETDIEKANKDKYTREEENKKLKKQNKELESKLFEYIRKFGDLEEDKENEEVEDE
mgnify:CR=1 FL=1